MTTEILGYEVTKTDTPQIPYELCGPRGARYGLMRSVRTPEMMFAINMRKFGVVDRLGWFTDRNGELEHVR